MTTTTPARPAPAQPTAPGPPGKRRNIPVCLLLFVVTLTVYGLYWVWSAHREIRRRANTGVGGWIGLAINLVVPFVTFFLVPYEARHMYAAEGETAPVGAWTGLWGLIPFIVAIAAVGTSPITTHTALWFLIPLVGTAVWFVLVQRALNRFWERAAAD
jgi:hypothetical protein